MKREPSTHERERFWKKNCVLWAVAKKMVNHPAMYGTPETELESYGRGLIKRTLAAYITDRNGLP